MYPRFCPGCGLNTTSHGAVVEVQEMYRNNHVDPSDPSELFDEQSETCGDCVRAFCSSCGHEFYNEKDEVYRTRDMIAKWFADVVRLDVSYVINDATALVRKEMETEFKQDEASASAQWDDEPAEE